MVLIQKHTEGLDAPEINCASYCMCLYDSLFSQLWPKSNDFENTARQEPTQLFSDVRIAGLGPSWAAPAFIRPNFSKMAKASLNVLQKLSIQVLLEDTSENPLG